MSKIVFILVATVLICLAEGGFHLCFFSSAAHSLLGLLSLFFVLTTNPTDLVLGMMLQTKAGVCPLLRYACRLSFLPAFQDELAKIRLALAIRGQELDKTLWQQLRAPFLLAIPLLTTAVLQGEQVSLAIKSRALVAYNQRTFLKTTAINFPQRLSNVVGFLPT